MMNKRKTFHIVALCLLGALVGLLQLSCSQYDYSSPLPGIITIRLHTISDTTNISFSPLNNFVLKVSQVQVDRSDGAWAVVYADLKATGRTTGIYNTLDATARDSSMVLGESYLPPGTYTAILMLIEPGSAVVLDGYRYIPVVRPPTLGSALVFDFPSGFKVSEGRRTNVVLTINLDSSLVKGPDYYIFNPMYYISSIQYE